MTDLDRKTFHTESARALRALDEQLEELDRDDLDVDLAGDVLTLEFAQGTDFIINAHSAAGQIWLAAGTRAWHFDLEQAGRWIAHKTGDELFETISTVVGQRLAVVVQLSAP